MVGRDACIGAPRTIKRNTSAKSVHINILPVLSEVLRWRSDPMMRHEAMMRHGGDAVAWGDNAAWGGTTRRMARTAACLAVGEILTSGHIMDA